MNGRLCLLVTLVGAYVLASPSPGRAHPASHVSIEWATANSDRVIVGKVLEVETVNKHDVVTVEVHRTLRGEQGPKADELRPKTTFVLQKYCSGYARGWLDDELPMVFFLVRIDGADHRDKLPAGYEWALNGHYVVLLGQTNRLWPGTMDVFTRHFDHLADRAAIVKYVGDYSRSIPPTRVLESFTVTVPYETSAYRKVFPPEYPGNAFYLRFPAGEQPTLRAREQTGPEAGRASEEGRYEFVLYVLGAVGACVYIWHVARRWSRRGA